MDDPLLSIVTGTRNRPESLALFVRSVLEHTRQPFELLIGDASEGPPFRSRDPRVRVFPEAVPLGYARGYNELFRRARGELVAYLNDDVEVLPHWSETVLAAFERHPEIDLVCIPLVEPGDPDPFLLLYQEMPVAQMGVLRREAGRALGWFDERFWFYGADTDLSLRVMDAGRRLAPAFGRPLLHHRLDDGERDRNMRCAPPDLRMLDQLWKRRLNATRRRYRRTSFPYFRGLEVSRRSDYGADVLRIPLEPNGLPRQPARPYRLKRRWLSAWT
jgi:glycosyltransferase involved in cell wall biosynthesis